VCCCLVAVEAYTDDLELLVIVERPPCVRLPEPERTVRLSAERKSQSFGWNAAASLPITTETVIPSRCAELTPQRGS
jgi:hypothetical protein